MSLVLFLFVTAALATPLHPALTETFGPDGTAASGGFGKPFGGGSSPPLMFNQDQRRLYVLRAGLYSFCCRIFPPQIPRGIYGFDESVAGANTPLSGGFPITIPAPTFTGMFAIDESEGNIYYADASEQSSFAVNFGTLTGYDAAGNQLGGGLPQNLTHPIQDMAVDPLGYLWAVDTGEFHRKLSKYAPDGTELASIDPSPVKPHGLAFDKTSGDLWVSGTEGNNLFIFRLTAASGYTEYDRRFSIGSLTDRFAVDLAHHVIYVLENESKRVVAYNESGGIVEQFGQLPSEIGSVYRGIAVDENDGTVYLLDDTDAFNHHEDRGGKVRVWNGVSGPNVTIEQPVEIGHTSATIFGHVDPAGGPDVTACEAQYAPDSAFNETKTLTVSGATGGTFAVFVGYGTSPPIPYNASAAEVRTALGAVPGLSEKDFSVSGAPGGPYTIEFGGRFGGVDMGPLFVRSEGLTPAGSQVTESTVHAGGNGWSSLSSVPCDPAVSPGSPIAGPADVNATLSGLVAGVTYRYRLAASSANGTVVSSEETFAPQPSLTTTGEATDVQRTAATLHGTIDPEGLETTFYFEYGKTHYYGKVSSGPPGDSLGAVSPGATPASAVLGGLQPGATYHYRIVAVNEKGTSVGGDRTFTAAPAVKHLSTDPATAIHRTDATLHGTVDPDGMQTDYYFEWGKTKRYGETSSPPPGADAGATSPGDKSLSAIAEGLTPETTYHYRLVARNASYGTTIGNDRTFTTPPAVKGMSTEPATEVGPTGATLNGKLDPDDLDTTYYFQWGKSSFYGHTVPAPPGTEVGSNAPGTVSVGQALQGLEPGTTYHFRLAGVNEVGTTFAKDRSFSTPQAPTIEGVFSANVSATGAELKARVNPQGFETRYRFEYGTTTQYGSVAPIPDGVVPASTTGQIVSVPIGGLHGVTYHFRLVVESQWGVTTSEDQTLDFNPPTCPNAAVRQQTGAAYLPDCRAYELVSPARAGGAFLIPEGPASPTASNRFSFSGTVNVIPGSGEPPNSGVSSPMPDLYVASRTTSGWITRYVGLTARQAFAQGGMPPTLKTAARGPGGILADGSLNRFLTWDNSPSSRSSAPYVWDNEGHGEGRLPSNLAEIPGASAPLNAGGFLGDARPSSDFGHYVFSSIGTAFAPGGRTTAPGSVYDDDLATGAVTLVSKTASNAPIPQDPAVGGSGEFIRIPAVSADGSHILMSTEAPGETTHLYMRVDDAVSYDISMGADSLDHGVTFAGMSSDGSEVYFTTTAQMTADDHDSSADLYRWRENDVPQLTRLSSGGEDAGDSDSCHSEWATGCGVQAVPTDTHHEILGSKSAQPIDSSSASGGGAIYFYSPEELDGARGVPGKRNLYVWQGGTVRHVATLDSLSEAARINVSPDGTHMAFVTQARIGTYDNAGHSEMYTYEPATRTLVCVSCKPDGSPPSSDVTASQNGIFMTGDGRAFFATADPLVSRDANGITDVYEYVDGRAQLISTGIGNDAGEPLRPIGLVGVSADGTNAFISTYETLVGQDENGPFLKFYDARVNGGFPFSKPAAPCAAADECHGAGSGAAAPVQIGSGARLGAGGNATRAKSHRRRHHKKHRKAKKPGRHRRGGSR